MNLNTWYIDRKNTDVKIENDSSLYEVGMYE